MTDPLDAIRTASQAYRLVVLWGHRPFPLLDPPAAHNPALVLTAWQTQAATADPTPSPLLALLPTLPPVTILSLDPTRAVETAFATAEVPLRVVCSIRDVPRCRGYNLLKLGGDLPTRQRVGLTRVAVGASLADADTRHLLQETARIGASGAVLLFSCGPADQDWLAWWNGPLQYLRRDERLRFFVPASDGIGDATPLSLSAEQLVTALLSADRGG